MAYIPEDSWQEFTATGSVAAYLAYREKSTQKSDSVPEEDQEQKSEES